MNKHETLPFNIPLAKYDDEPKAETPDGTIENMTTAQLKEELEKCGIKFIPSKKSY